MFVCILTDNTFTVAALNNMWSAAPRAQQHLLALLTYLRTNNCTVHAAHILGTLNVAADYLSRDMGV